MRLMCSMVLALMLFFAGAAQALANIFVVTVTGTIGSGYDDGPFGNQGNLAGVRYRAVQTFTNVPGAETTSSTSDQLYGVNIAAFGPIGLSLTVGDFTFAYAVPSSLLGRFWRSISMVRRRRSPQDLGYMSR